MTDTIPPVVARRRNGAIASCEPCRKRKTRCDHGRPVCNSCQQRGLEATCFYHPAPLTKRPGSEVRVDRAGLDDRLVTPIETFSTTAASRPDEFLAGASAEHRTTSSALQLPPCSKTIQPNQVAAITQTLRHLRGYEYICGLVTAYYSASQAPVIPGSLIASALPSLRNTIEKFGLFNGTAPSDAELLPLSEAVFRSTSTSTNIDAFLTPSSFMNLYTGDTLRLEYLGILFSVAARSFLIGLASKEQHDDTFLQDMFSCSTTCLQIAREISPINDMLVWLGQDHLMLTSCIEGDSSECTWRHSGNLLSDILALGIYRESFNVTNTPFFLTECRRKIFARVYYMDKFVSTLLDRPPRLLKQYSDSQWPLDLTDTELLAGPLEVAEARAKLTWDGWNTERKFCASSWARVRCIAAEILERIYKYKFLPLTEENVAELKNVLKQSREAWKSIPSHLHYNIQCWNSGLHPQTCLMLTVIRLAFLQCDFQTLQILEPSDPHSAQQLLNISAEIISLINELGSFRRKAVYLQVRFSYILESISGPAEPNYNTCFQASSTITGILDELLNTPPSHFGHRNAISPSARFACLENFNSVSIGAGTFGADGVEESEEFDLLNWAISVDWAATRGEWSMF